MGEVAYFRTGRAAFSPGRLTCDPQAITHARFRDNIARRQRIIRQLLPEMANYDAQIMTVLRMGRAPDIDQQLPLSLPVPDGGRGRPAQRTPCASGPLRCHPERPDDRRNPLSDHPPPSPRPAGSPWSGSAAAGRDCGPGIPGYRRAWSRSRWRRHPGRGPSHARPPAPTAPAPAPRTIRAGRPAPPGHRDRAAQVEDDQVRLAQRRLGQALGAGGGFADLVALGREADAQEFADLGFVVDDEDVSGHLSGFHTRRRHHSRCDCRVAWPYSAGGAGSGRCMRSVVPRPSRPSSTLTRPPWAPTMPWQIASPRPVPCPPRSPRAAV